MEALTKFRAKKDIRFIFTDIDGTLTSDGRMPADSYQALWDLHKKNISVIPITGRPAGWCEMIARLWPVESVIGENGAFYFRYHKQKMKRHFVHSEKQRTADQKKLAELQKKILKEIPGCAISSDQFARMFDLAIDFCEDVPKLPKSAVNKIVKIFEKAGATAKVSSIHVNGWFGDYDKLSMCKEYLKREHKLDLQKIQDQVAFVGDSPNDEPLFKGFKNSFAVANIQDFIKDLKHKPAYVASKPEGSGFVEVANAIMGRTSSRQFKLS